MKKALAHISVAPAVRKPITLRVRLVSGLTLLGLFAGLGLLASRPAHTAGGPVPVAVTNTPLSVADISVRQPFQEFDSIRIPDGKTFANGNLIPVPSGKRLVIQMVSVWRSGVLTPGQGIRTFVGCTVNGQINFYPLPFVPTDETTAPGAMQAVTLYADPGTGLEVNVFRSGSSGEERDYVSVSGYLVDVT